MTVSCRCLGSLALVLAVPASGPERISGFSSEGTEREAAVEDAFRAIPRPESASRHLRALTEEPHLAGTPADYETARYVHERFLEFGLSSEIVPYDVLLSYPEEVKLELVVPEAF